MNKKNFLVWVVLIALTSMSYFSANSQWPAKTVVWSLLIATTIKFMGVGFQFMELKNAHIFWKVSFVTIFLLYFSIVLFAI